MLNTRLIWVAAVPTAVTQLHQQMLLDVARLCAN
jgi:hypothetical protein